MTVVRRIRTALFAPVLAVVVALVSQGSWRRAAAAEPRAAGSEVLAGHHHRGQHAGPHHQQLGEEEPGR